MKEGGTSLNKTSSKYSLVFKGLKLNNRFHFYFFGRRCCKRVKADWSWPLKPYKTSPDKTKKHFPQNMQEKVKLTFEYDTVGPCVKPDTINELYQTKRPHGIVIISNMKFTDHLGQEGTEKDEKNLSRTFRYLGYDVVIYQNRKA